MTARCSRGDAQVAARLPFRTAEHGTGRKVAPRNDSVRRVRPRPPRQAECDAARQRTPRGNLGRLDPANPRSGARRRQARTRRRREEIPEASGGSRMRRRSGRPNPRGEPHAVPTPRRRVRIRGASCCPPPHGYPESRLGRRLAGFDTRAVPIRWRFGTAPTGAANGGRGGSSARGGRRSPARRPLPVTGHSAVAATPCGGPLRGNGPPARPGATPW